MEDAEAIGWHLQLTVHSTLCIKEDEARRHSRQCLLASALCAMCQGLFYYTTSGSSLSAITTHLHSLLHPSLILSVY